MYPRYVTERVLRDAHLRARFARLLAPASVAAADVAEAHESAADESEHQELARWVLHEAHRGDASIRRYAFQLKTLAAVFEGVHEHFDKVNPLARGDKDAFPIQTSVDSMLLLSAYLYYLDSHGVAGDVLECGCFKGFSSCCLSWTCALLDRRLVIADSFRGLPANDTQPFYDEGDFHATRAEVEGNLAVLGRRDRVDVIEGFYRESLRGFDRPLAALWLDVDLHDSARDALEHTFDRLASPGLLFSDEFAPRHVDDSGRIVGETGVPKAVRSALERRQASYCARHLVDWVALVAPGAGPDTAPSLEAAGHRAFLRVLRSER